MMMKQKVWAGALLAGAAFAAQAAEPASGTLTLDSGPIEFGQGPNVGVNPTPAADAVTCADPVLACDHFDLTIDLPENLVEFFPSALVTMEFTWDDLTGAGVEDYDIYLYDAAGNSVNSSATGNMPEFMSQLANGGVEQYTFDVVFFAVLGSTYKGVVTLELGEPAEGVDTEEFFMQNSVLGHALQNPVTAALAGEDNEEAESRSDSYVERRAASGSLGFLGLILAAAGLGRRRRR